VQALHGYETTGWENFFVAEAGASAALAGLLVVAMSINLNRILSFPQLPGRAAEGLLVLVGVLLSSTLGLVPGQPRVVLGGELLLAGLFIWLFPMVNQLRAAHLPNAPRYWMVTRVLAHQMGSVPLVAAGVTLMLGEGGGLYWLAAGAVLSFCAGIINAWVLLVEIQR
jgi:modulator of FtsH protease